MKVEKAVMECNACGGREKRWNATPTPCPWCGDGVMRSAHEEDETDETSGADVSGWTWTMPLVLNALRNPHGWSEDRLREARQMAADEIERLEREHARLREVERASFDLTAALAQLPPGYEAGETEFLNRERVMAHLMAWRKRFDYASKQHSPKELSK